MNATRILWGQVIAVISVTLLGIWSARWQEYSTEPLVILDTGHNHAGLREVFAQLDEIKRFKP
ncbi:hypothetical protein [Novosphingobium sp.]|uniref:hypothetical protein n=1 Tax=Novosphingobium sp. TaxID=1874826 RepID=UPI0026292DE6|nr:hypothetical protein [Novosphingobium sp.]